jgi:hypothetical protein
MQTNTHVTEKIESAPLLCEQRKPEPPEHPKPDPLPPEPEPPEMPPPDVVPVPKLPDERRGGSGPPHESGIGHYQTFLLQMRQA